MSNNSTYLCIEPVQFNGKRYEPGRTITLSEDDATPLLAAKAIEEDKAPAEKAAAEKAAAEKAETEKAAAEKAEAEKKKAAKK